ncbi:hypothetical protein FB45DRAFT_1017909 [Roridomyces roridus]|uniref:Uncharacterized protein n=1 Tax=Roridomyces roridus TaxID=1738132 RepID=A0AAD7G2B0_9AGAR|nr:hypothetical protein FB45DRAFT_1017909 [Roridomyces roridus]
MLDGWRCLSPMEVAEHLPHLETLHFENVFPYLDALALPACRKSVLDLERPPNSPRDPRKDLTVFQFECNLLGRWTGLCPSLVNVTLMSGMRCRLLEGKWRVIDSAGVPGDIVRPIPNVFDREGHFEGNWALALDELPYY